MISPADPRGLAEMIAKAFRKGRAEGLSIDACAEIIADVVKAKLEDDDPASTADVLAVQSVVSAATGNPLVQCRIGGERWQWEPEEARAHAARLLQVTEAAVHDAAMVRWLTLSMGMDQRAALEGLLDLRRFRGDVAPEDWRPADAH